MSDTNAKSVEEKESKAAALHYMQTLVDVARESFLILDSDLKVVLANPTFYETFKVDPAETEHKFIYELGNGQWDIETLKSLLEKILPEKKIITGYEVAHTFEAIGQKTMLLNAKQIDSVQLIILAIEDISARKELENKLAENVRDLQVKVSEQTVKLTERISELELLNKAMVGREIKMMELKKENEDLKKQITK